MVAVTERATALGREVVRMLVYFKERVNRRCW